PATVHVGLYEEFPSPERLKKLTLVDFPVSLAVAAPSHSQFVVLRDEILANYPAVVQVYFWPVLPQGDGYYAGPLSATPGLQQAMREAEGLPALWDLELPRGPAHPVWSDWLRNRNE